ncbi:MAG: Na+/H+ antiporter subunit E [Pseudomonadota bacterium]
MSRLVILVVALSGLWLLLSGYFTKPLLLGFGVVSVILSVYLAVRAGVLDGEGVPDGLMPRVFGYWWWLFFEIGKANLVVARHALAINPKLSPKVIKVKSPTRTNAGLATFCNSVTLTPGTVTIDLEPDYFVVHALTEECADEAAIDEMGRRVAALEGPPALGEYSPAIEAANSNPSSKNATPPSGGTE